METRKEKDLLLIKYKEKWFFKENDKYHQWFDLDLKNIDWQVNVTPITTRKFIIPVNNISDKKSKKLIDKIKKKYQKDLWFPDMDPKFQKEIKRFVRNEKLKQIKWKLG